MNIVFRYRAREISIDDIDFIKKTISEYYEKGRSYISRKICESWNWLQPDGKYKEYAARDLLLRLEEKGYIELPPRIKNKNNTKERSYEQIPLFFRREDLSGLAGDYQDISIKKVSAEDEYLWSYLLHHYHYLGLPRLVGEYIKHIAYIDDQAVGCLAWASAAWKIRSRDEHIGWDSRKKEKNLHLVANNTRFLILPWIRVKYLASKVLAMSLSRLRDDWEAVYNHPVYLAETFVDISRFKGTCYKAANWRYVGETAGSAKRGNEYKYHGLKKSIFLYPLDHNYRELLNDDQG